MIDLGKQYMDDGFFLEGGELPDFVPVYLEYASCLAPAQATEMLGQPAHVFAALSERLDKRGSDYGAVFRCVVSLAKARVDPTPERSVEQIPIRGSRGHDAEGRMGRSLNRPAARNGGDRSVAKIGVERP